MTQIGAVGVSALQVKDMDLESALMAIQSSRAEMLEGQLKEQIDAVQAKNNQVAGLNSLLGQLNVVASRLNANATASTCLEEQHAKDGKVDLRANDLKDGLTAALKDAGINPALLMPSGQAYGDKHDFDINAVTKSDLDGAISKLKGNVDSLTNSQQMDMLRLQSMSNKRNEAFDLMTNFSKKLQDGRNAIVSNMR